MKLLSLLFILIFTQACDQPYKERRERDKGLNNSIQDASGNAVTTSQLNCKTGILAHTGTNTGTVQVCVEAKSPAPMKISLKSTIDHGKDNELCVIPMFKNSQGKSDYLGDSHCNIQIKGNTVISIDIPKARYGNYIIESITDLQRLGVNNPKIPYNALPINSLILMKKSIKNQFINCMHASSDLAQKANLGYCNSHGAECQAILEYKENICAQFVSNKDKNYISLDLP